MELSMQRQTPGNKVGVVLTGTGTQVSREAWISYLRLDKTNVSQIGFTTQAYLNKSRNTAFSYALTKTDQEYLYLVSMKQPVPPQSLDFFLEKNITFGWCGENLWFNLNKIGEMKDPYFRYTPLEGSIQEFAERVKAEGHRVLELPYSYTPKTPDKNGIIQLGGGEAPKEPGVALLMIASWETVHMLFSVANMTMDLDNITSIYMYIKETSGSADMPLARNLLVKKAMEEDPDSGYIFFLDVDMQVGHTAIPYLLKQHRDVIGGVYYQRGEPYFPHTMYSYAQQRLKRIIDFPTTPNTPFKCSGQGTGALLINKRVFNKISYPWFDLLRHSVEDGMIGEDYYFSWKCKEAGIQEWADGSVPTVHLGDLSVDRTLAEPFKKYWRTPERMKG